MPTYQIGGAGRKDGGQPVPVRSLTCERCGAALGSVTAVQPHAGMTKTAVCDLFPTARTLVESHEAECRSAVGPAA